MTTELITAIITLVALLFAIYVVGLALWTMWRDR